MAGLRREATHRHRVVRQGESPKTAQGLPLLDPKDPACAPLWRLFDGDPMPAIVRRQARALCVRCARQDDCEGAT